MFFRLITYVIFKTDDSVNKKYWNSYNSIQISLGVGRSVSLDLLALLSLMKHIMQSNNMFWNQRND